MGFYAPYNSPDGRSKDTPLKVKHKACPECYNIIIDEICPFCGNETELEYEPDDRPEPDEE